MYFKKKKHSILNGDVFTSAIYMYKKHLWVGGGAIAILKSISNIETPCQTQQEDTDTRINYDIFFCFCFLQINVQLK